MNMHAQRKIEYAMVFAHSAGELGFALSARRKTESKFHSAVATVLDFV